jgi:hypothetical protein
MQIPNDRPAYEILSTSGFHGPDQHLYQEGDYIVFDGIPNEEMRPLNELARKKLEEYSAYLDAHAKKAAEKLGKEFTGRSRSFDANIAQAREAEQARQIQLIKGGPGVPLMGGKDPNAPAIGKIEPEPMAETTRQVKPGPASIQQPRR